MSQIFLAIFTVAAAAFAVFEAAVIFKCPCGCLTGLFYELDFFMSVFSGQVAFFMFSITAAIAASVIVSFSHIASQWIISLDILFLLTAFLLVKYHRLKLHPSASL